MLSWLLWFVGILIAVAVGLSVFHIYEVPFVIDQIRSLGTDALTKARSSRLLWWRFRSLLPTLPAIIQNCKPGVSSDLAPGFILALGVFHCISAFRDISDVSPQRFLPEEGAVDGNLLIQLVVFLAVAAFAAPIA